MENFDLNDYLTKGVENIVKGVWKASLKNPAASIFMMKYLKNNKKTGNLRKEAQRQGKHIPPFLIASITTNCNLHCKGCYARENHSCFDEVNFHEVDTKHRILTEKQWADIFDEAEEIGISFILLAGGEPMLRKEILEVAGEHKKILFPIFTNGTMFTADNMKLIVSYPNLLPILSIEGKAQTTDARRGTGMYQKLLLEMSELQKREIIFGCSVTVQKGNIKEVMGDEFLCSLIEKGCKSVIYVEYVPINSDTVDIAPDDSDRLYMIERLTELRERYSELVFVSFPGDEKTSGGCLAAGRGFFHINAYGGAEPCPFSAYSDTSLQEVSLLDALQSPLFQKIQKEEVLMKEHTGGCVLFENEEIVKKFLIK